MAKRMSAKSATPAYRKQSREAWRRGREMGAGFVLLDPAYRVIRFRAGTPELVEKVEQPSE